MWNAAFKTNQPEVSPTSAIGFRISSDDITLISGLLNTLSFIPTASSEGLTPLFNARRVRLDKINVIIACTL